ncbi:uncharacterized protein LOC133790428 [Humulus lupulus]|uniref:uncharacterized protein LOC133790428 n=1 Tax=Humulus lupulus TaxID=3486 RepID=UPI002B40AD92|nr:uncharacterized protein LOC133790428 [Humulus lupulus]
MISSHHCSWLKPVSFSSYSPFWEKKGQPSSSSSSSSSYSSGYIVCSLEKDQSQQHFEVDQEKAREALKKLDQQLQSLSQKQLRSPKIKASDVKLTRRVEYEESEVEVVSEFSASFLASTAGLLFLLTIFYNIFFITVVKPSIDIPDQPPTTAIQRDNMS